MRKYELGLERKPTFNELITGILREKDPLKKFLPDRTNYFAVKSLQFSNLLRESFNQMQAQEMRETKENLNIYLLNKLEIHKLIITT